MDHNKLWKILQEMGVPDHLTFLQGIFLTQGSNMGLLHCRQILYLLNYKGSSLLCLPPAEFPNPRTELMSPALQADSLHMFAPKARTGMGPLPKLV